MSAAEEWVRQHRASSEISDAIDGWDVAGADLESLADPERHTEFQVIVCGRKTSAERLAQLLGNPLKP